MKNSFYEAELCTPTDFIGLDRYCDYTTGTGISTSTSYLLYILEPNGGEEVNYLTYPDIYCVDGMTFTRRGTELFSLCASWAQHRAHSTQAHPALVQVHKSFVCSPAPIQLSNYLTI